MSAHTPGPWQVKSEHEPEYIVGDIDGPDDGTMYYQPVAMVMETKQFAANARLIAAAPELLSELRKAADTFADLATFLSITGKEASAAGCRIAEASHRALIAKATGATA
jgi:hypothetical protein